MAKKLDFKDFLNVDYMPGEPDLIKRNAKKRKSADTATSGPNESVEVDEALSPTQRRARGRQMKRMKTRIEVGREKAARRMASQDKLQTRARRAARKKLFQKLTKGIPKSELTFQRRQEIEKRLDKMKSRIDRIAQKMLPAARKAEMERLRNRNQQAND